MSDTMASSVSSTEKKFGLFFGGQWTLYKASKGVYLREIIFLAAGVRVCEREGGGGVEGFDHLDKMVHHHLLSPSKRYNSSLSGVLLPVIIARFKTIS